MSGWLRLWVLLSVFWLIAATFYFYQNFIPIRDVDELEIIRELDPNASQYFREWSHEHKELTYYVSFSFTDGTQGTIRFPFLSEEEIEDVERRVKALSDRENRVISENEMSRFVALVKAENIGAGRAMQQFESIAIEKKVQEEKRHGRYIFNVIAMLIAFPAGSFLTGTGFGWVYQGFKNSKGSSMQ
ncbi:MAG: hypothetical protein VYA99_10105 [Pseudomonadota bacterium]|nr:hypothetical protein [Pseudomonadota bacterium]